MTEVKKLLHADIQAETYTYEVEETAEHLTVVHLARGASGGWNYKVEARHIEAKPANSQSADVSGEGSDFATPDEAIAAARAHARSLLAG